jgi:hypothetical protein
MSRAAGLVAHWHEHALRPYRTRAAASVYAQLDDAHFSAMNDGSHDLDLACTGCLDALDELPSGSASDGRRGQPKTIYDHRAAYYPILWAERDWLTPQQMAARDALADRLISEILAEESAAAS